MAYLSLYRKFRPSKFDDMVRQEHVVRVLKNQIAADTVGHAYLFTGPRGTGKTSVARIFARAVNCEHPVNGSPCGRCAVCRALSDGSLDVVEIDAASNNGVNEMRDLREKVQYPPVTGKYKVYIIDEVHMLTDSAFNALLKTLEEPPAHAIFILATTEPQKIPATILSRCMRLDFKLIPTEDLVSHLKSVLGEIGRAYEEEAVVAIARAGAGSDRDMLSIAEMCLAYSEKLTYEGVTTVLGAADFLDTAALCGEILKPDLGAALEKTENILSEGRSVGVLCRDILQILNMVAIAKSCRNAEALLAVSSERFHAVSEIEKFADGRAILRATELFSKLETELRYASSPRICLETAVMRAALPETQIELDALAARVNGVERKLSEGVQKVEISQDSPKKTKKEPKIEAKQPQEQEDFYDDGYEFPTEEPVFEEAYFSDGALPESVPFEKAESVKARETVTASVAQPVAERSVAPAAPTETSAAMAFGKFLRTLRKSSRNGVLFTMCADLEAQFSDSVLILTTDSDTVYRSLNKEEHRKLMRETFAEIGVPEYRLVKRGEESADVKGGIEEIKRNFSNYNVEIK